MTEERSSYPSMTGIGHLLLVYNLKFRDGLHRVRLDELAGYKSNTRLTLHLGLYLIDQELRRSGDRCCCRWDILLLLNISLRVMILCYGVAINAEVALSLMNASDSPTMSTTMHSPSMALSTETKGFSASSI